MKIVEVRGVKIGEGRPKICVPIVGADITEIRKEARDMRHLPAEVVEWRADCFDEVMDTEKVRTILQELRDILGEIPILFTFRTKKEGGKREISFTDYEKLLIFVSLENLADIIDVEAFFDDGVVGLIKKLHENGSKVIASNHDFNQTPEKDEIVRRLRYMQQIHADISKIAVMPQDAGNVLTLLEATQEMKQKYADRPVVTMSMGAYGMISRLNGEVFGSALTFGAGAKSSAPGQVPAADLKVYLEWLHKSIS